MAKNCSHYPKGSRWGRREEPHAPGTALQLRRTQFPRRRKKGGDWMQDNGVTVQDKRDR